eukprot:TRINITY_DN3298_c0_g4_i1.p1 TRINITY_DN3298_c0_g4~~TRINITY_DN3298_c0_g4_i1.p1  ORF type:complete len:441 (+),score=76.65 TRINITY_DN3298_c0_g4_i1:45-1325(+)
MATAQQATPTFRKPLQFEVLATFNRARVSKLWLPHYTCSTPMFMPVGTQGTVKGLTTQQLQDLDCHVILGNTYHLGLRPGGEVMEQMGGLHRFENWPRGLLTDSGGFQMVSLLKLAKITEEGVEFCSPHDGSPMLLTPEKSMHLQNQIGADIMMALDDVVSSTTTGPRVAEACARSIRWLDRCIAAHKRPSEQNLFGIIQGGLDAELRTKCLKEMIERDLNGYAIGGLSGGEAKESFWRIVAQCTASLPADKPRYLMGVGYAVDMVVASALGVDMFDCVYPTRTARFGSALVDTGVLHLRQKQFANDLTPVEEACDCSTCKNYTRSMLHNLLTKEPLGAQLLTYHNVAYQMRLMRRLRQSILDSKFPEFVREFMAMQFPDREYPLWTVDALREAGIELTDAVPPKPKPASKQQLQPEGADNLDLDD